MEEKLKKRYKVLNKVLITLLIVVISFSTIFTFALYKDVFFGNLDINFGDVQLNVKDGVSDAQVLNFNLTRTNSGGTPITKAMPGDDVTISVKLSLASGSEPCYYLISVWGSREIFGEGFNSEYFYENGEVYVVDKTTRHLPNDETSTTSSYVGELNKNETIIVDITTKIPLETEKETFIKYSQIGAKARCMIYAIQKANVSQSEAYNLIKEAMPPYYYCNENGEKDLSGEYIMFGEYPQTVKASNVSILSGPDENGYYTGSDGESYVLRHSSLYCGTNFSNGQTISYDNYYFKVEPILWKILKIENNKALLFSAKGLDNVAYQLADTWNVVDNVWYLNAGLISYDGDVSDGTEYVTNYKFSNARIWLNTTFFNNFTEKEQSIINLTQIDDYTRKDSFFLLGRYDFGNPYFNSNNARKRIGSDIVVSRTNSLNKTTNAIHYATRGNYGNRSLAQINSNGQMSSDPVATGEVNIVPAVEINLV